jgi:hypothetical protein
MRALRVELVRVGGRRRLDQTIRNAFLNTAHRSTNDVVPDELDWLMTAPTETTHPRSSFETLLPLLRLHGTHVV